MPNELPVLPVTRPWYAALTVANTDLSNRLAYWLVAQRWFSGKSRRISEVTVGDLVPFESSANETVLAFVSVSFAGDAAGQEYACLLQRTSDPGEAEPLARLADESGTVVCEASLTGSIAGTMLDGIRQESTVQGERGRIRMHRTEALADLDPGGQLPVRLVGAEQSNSSLLLGQSFIFKVYRRPESGLNPDLEICRYLTEVARYPHSPRLAGWVDYEALDGTTRTLGLLQQLIPNEGDAWDWALSQGRAAAAGGDTGRFRAGCRLLGQRTAELHAALAAGSGPDFEPEPIDAGYVGLLVESMQERLNRLLALETAPAQLAAMAPLLSERIEALRGLSGAAVCIRTHGDYHLGQVLWTGDDFVIIDFEGEPARTLAQRRQKHPALRDVAGMLRSFEYAGATVAQEHPGWDAVTWIGAARAAFLDGYLQAADGGLLPDSSEARESLLGALEFEKALYELEYELNNRPDWADIPLSALASRVGFSKTAM